MGQRSRIYASIAMAVALVVLQIPSYVPHLQSTIPRAAAAVSGYGAAFANETAPTVVAYPGQTKSFMTFFSNTGTTTWAPGPTQVNLARCAPAEAAGQFDCNVSTPYGDWASGWLSPTAYATHSTTVAPDSIGTFAWNVTVPTGAIGGDYPFYFAVVLGTTGERILDQIFKQTVRIPQGNIYTVNSNGDAPTCNVDICTLRGAITEAERDPAPPAVNTIDTIVFNLPAAARTISPESALPTIRHPVVIDATTQPGFLDQPIVELNGSFTTSGNGLTYGSSAGGGGLVRGLVINSFKGYGIFADGGGGNVIAGNFIGTNLAGTAAAGNGTSVPPSGGGMFVNTPGYTIGGFTPNDANFIAGNFGNGIEIASGDAPLTRVIGNYIGRRPSVRTSVPNGISGVYVGGPSATVEQNFISSNLGSGIALASDFGTFRDNFVLDNRGSGILMSGSGNVFDRNDIRANGGGGVFMGFPNATTQDNVFTDNTVRDNSGRGFTLRGPVDQTNEITDRNTIRRGSISGNQLEGILLAFGANEGIAPPTLRTSDAGGVMTVSGAASPSATVDVYVDPADEGIQFVDSTTASRLGSWTLVIPAALRNAILAREVRAHATQTDLSGNTSQFSVDAATDVISGTASCGGDSLANVTVQLLQGDVVLATTTSDGSGRFTFTGVGPGTFTLKFIFGEGEPCTQQVTLTRGGVATFGDANQCDRSNTWPTAIPLDATLNTAIRQEVLGVICDGGRLWYKIRIPTPPTGTTFTVPPLSRIVARLTGTDGGRLPGDFTLMLVKDPNLALRPVSNSADAHTQFAGDTFGGDTFGGDTFGGDTFGGDTFGGDTFGGDTFGGDTFGGDTFGGDTFGGDTFGGDTFGGDTFGGDTFGGDTFGGDTFGGDTFGGDTFGGGFATSRTLRGGDPRAYSAAIARSVVRVSAHRGTSQEGLWQNTWAHSITWYLRVSSYRGSAGAFHLSSQVFTGLCDGVTVTSATSALLPPTDSASKTYNTLILRNSLSDGAYAAANLRALQTSTPPSPPPLAEHPTVNGAVVDFALDGGLTAAYQQYKDHPFCPAAANIIAEGIRGYIRAFKDANPELRWILIAASDEGIPFYRVPDYASIAPQNMLIMPLKPLTVEGELRLNFFGTDDAYGDLHPVQKTDHFLFIPELGVGRISEPKHVVTMVSEYIRAAGVLTPQTAAVYGYNFWNDAASSIQKQLVDSGKSVNQFPTAHPKIQSGQGLPTDTDAWNAQDLIDGVAANTDVVVLMAHGLRASEIAPANYFPTVKPQQLMNLANTTPAIKRLKLLVTGACNFGLAIPSAQGITNVTPDPRLAEIPQALGWTAVAWDSYAYGDDERIAYSEELADDLFTELRYGGSNDVVVLGDAIARVKRDWAARQTDLKGIHQKSLMGMGILGFPMLRVNMGSVGRLGERPKGLADFTSGALVAVTTGPGSDAALNLRTTNVAIDFDAAGHQLMLKNLSLTNIGAPGSTTASYYQIQTSDVPPRSFVQMNPLEPIAPRWSIPLHPSDLPDSDPTFARGAVLMSATCLDEGNFIPLISAPGYQLTPPRGPYLADRFEPNDWWKVNYLNSGREFLLLRPGLFRSTRSATGAPEIFGTERTFRQVTFRAYYSWLVGAEISDTAGHTMQAIHAGPPEFLRHSAAPNGAGTAVNFETMVSALPNVGIQSVFVTWWNEAATCGSTGSGLNSIELATDGTSQRWSGSLTLPSGVSASNVRYLLQAVNGAGRVRVADNFGLGFPAETPPTAPVPTADTDLVFTQVASVVPPASATVASGRKITVGAQLTRGDTNPDVAGKRLIFRLSGANGDRAFAYTGADGIATANLKVDTLPGSFFVHVEFEGNDDLAGSSARSPEIIVTRETTSFTDISLAPTTQQQGGTIQVSARLRDGLSRPLREQGVLFLITAPACTAYPADASSPTAPPACTVLQAQGAETDYAGRARASIPLRGVVGASYRVHVAFAGKVKVPTGDPLAPFVTLNLENARYEPGRAALGLVTVVNQRIAFTSSRTGNGDIYSMNIDGSDVRRLTDSSAIDADPDWSPDRTKIAFTSSRTGNGDVYVMNSDGSGQTRLTTSGGIDTLGSWSPDGTKIAFTSTRDGNAEIYLMNADGSGQTRLTNNPRIDADPFWSPDGTKIAFTSTRDGNAEVYVMNADGSNPKRLTVNGAIDTLGSWSPDGSKILFSSGRTGNGDIYVMNADGTGVTRLTTSNGIDASPDWSPDGTRIVFASNRDGFFNSEIYIMNANGSSQTRLTFNAAFDGLPSW